MGWLDDIEDEGSEALESAGAAYDAASQSVADAYGGDVDDDVSGSDATDFIEVKGEHGGVTITPDGRFSHPDETIPEATAEVAYEMARMAMPPNPAGDMLAADLWLEEKAVELDDRINNGERPEDITVGELTDDPLKAEGLDRPISITRPPRTASNELEASDELTDALADDVSGSDATDFVKIKGEHGGVTFTPNAPLQPSGETTAEALAEALLEGARRDISSVAPGAGASTAAETVWWAGGKAGEIEILIEDKGERPGDITISQLIDDPFSGTPAADPISITRPHGSAASNVLEASGDVPEADAPMVLTSPDLVGDPTDDLTYDTPGDAPDDVAPLDMTNPDLLGDTTQDMTYDTPGDTYDDTTTADDDYEPVDADVYEAPPEPEPAPVETDTYEASPEPEPAPVEDYDPGASDAGGEPDVTTFEE